MDNDDQPVGRLLTRREMLKLMAALGAAAAAGCAPRLPAATLKELLDPAALTQGGIHAGGGGGGGG